jgi:threonine/homoserine/homoserine lactone efflux protein
MRDIAMNIGLFGIESASLLCMPGPTNTLLAIAGSTAGIRKSLHLPLLEGAAYTISTGFLVMVVAPILSSNSTLLQLFRLLCCAVLWYQAVYLWRSTRADRFVADSYRITGRQLFAATLVNPKNLIFAFVIFVNSGFVRTEYGLWLMYFLPLCIGIGSLWIAVGAGVSCSIRNFAKPVAFYRIGACVLFLFGSLIFLNFAHDATFHA